MTPKEKYLISLGCLFCMTMFALLPSEGEVSTFSWAIYFIALFFLARTALRNGLKMVNEKHIKNNRLPRRR